jgi:hypothetical protein
VVLEELIPGLYYRWVKKLRYSAIVIEHEPIHITLSNSGYISASGENTTARLTAPSGKSTSDFTAGRIQDDENPCDAIDIGNSKYTEIEWCLIATNYASTNDVFEFKITVNGTVLDTYTYTPTWTIGTPGGASVIPLIMRTYRNRRVT